MNWNKQDIIRELVGEFGEEYREDIEVSLDLEHGNYSDFGRSGNVKIGFDEYVVIKDEDEAERIAFEVAKQQLKDDPELFDKDWLIGYVYIYKDDKDAILADEEDEIRRSVEEDADIEFEPEEDLLLEEEWENPEEEKAAWEKLERKKKEWIEVEVENRLFELEKKLDDPISYFKSLGYSLDEILRLPFISIDIEIAAEDAVSTYGWVHFLNFYDDKYDTTKNGMVYFRRD